MNGRAIVAAAVLISVAIVVAALLISRGQKTVYVRENTGIDIYRGSVYGQTPAP